MKILPEYLNYFLSDCSRLPLRAKRMFWSYGIYLHDTFIGIYHDESFYIKRWNNSLDVFDNQWKTPFSYTKWEKTTYLKNYLLLDDTYIEEASQIDDILLKSIQTPQKIKKENSDPIKKAVLNILKKIPTWKVTTYKILADTFGVHPRKISMIMKYNTLPDEYPCYKVIAHDGKLSGYNTSGWVDDKISRLQSDGILIENWKISPEYFYYFNKKDLE